MTERPIIFSGPMVRAIQEDRKTNTRRVVTPQPELVDARGKWRIRGDGSWPIVGRRELLAELIANCSYGKPEDRLWVRECFALYGMEAELEQERPIFYRADDDTKPGWATPPDIKWKPSIHMPRWASRITLEIAKVRVERVQEISFEDCLAEGVIWTEHWDNVKGADIERLATKHPEGITVDESIDQSWIDYTRLAFRALWDSINAKRGFAWEKNPWTWVLEFKKATQRPGDGAPSPARG